MSEDKKVYRVLIIDDAFFIRNLIKRAIVTKPEDDNLDYKFDVIGEAINGKEGLINYFKLNPDLITLDINMPDINGIEVAKQILSKDPNAKIIAISGNLDEKIKQDILNAGALAYIQKPFQNNILWEKLDMVVDIITGVNKASEPIKETEEMLEIPEEKSVIEEIIIPSQEAETPKAGLVSKPVVNEPVNEEATAIIHKQEKNISNKEAEKVANVSVPKFEKVEETLEIKKEDDVIKEIEDEEEDDLLSVRPKIVSQEPAIKVTPEIKIVEEKKTDEPVSPVNSLSSIKFGSGKSKKEANPGEVKVKEENKQTKSAKVPKPMEIPTPVIITEHVEKLTEEKTVEKPVKKVEEKPVNRPLVIPIDKFIPVELDKPIILPNTDEEEDGNVDDLEKNEDDKFKFEIEFDIDKELPKKETLVTPDDELIISLPDEETENVGEIIIPTSKVEEKEEVILIQVPTTSKHTEPILDSKKDDELIISIPGSKTDEYRDTGAINVSNTPQTSNEELKKNDTNYNTVSNEVDNSEKDEDGNKGFSIAPPRSKVLKEMYSDIVHNQYKTTYPDEPTEPEPVEEPKKEGKFSNLIKKLFNKK